MGLKPFDWSVVIIGRWNTAILTPARVSKKILNLERGTIMPVMVPIDGISPYQIEHPEKKIVITPDTSRLLIGLTQMNYEALGDAMEAGINTLKWLPETPVSAAGFNVNFRTETPDVDMIKIYENPTLDKSLAGLGHEIINWGIRRSLAYNAGKFNITVTGKPQYFDIQCNFHRESKKNEELVQWLEMPAKDIDAQVKKLLQQLNLDLEAISDEDE